MVHPIFVIYEGCFALAFVDLVDGHILLGFLYLSSASFVTFCFSYCLIDFGEEGAVMVSR